MKDIIVLIAVLPFTLALLLFPMYAERNGGDESFVRETVYSAAQQAGRDGYFSAGNIDDIKNDIAAAMDIEKKDIKIVADRDIKYRPEVINYRVEVPIKNVVPANKMFGIKDEQNKGEIVIESKIMSERLAP